MTEIYLQIVARMADYMATHLPQHVAHVGASGELLRMQDIFVEQPKHEPVVGTHVYNTGI